MNAVFSVGAAVEDRWIYGTVLCKIVGLLYIATCDIALLIILFMAVDRFIAITKPLRYHSLVTRKRILIAVASAFPGFPGIMYWAGTVNRAFDNVCYIPDLATCMIDLANPAVAHRVIGILSEYWC